MPTSTTTAASIRRRCCARPSRTLIARKKVEGASTLTQQLAKQRFLTPEKSWRRKINEAFLAIQIEKDFTKDQIFELYANQMYLGHGAYGVESASRLYFGKHAKDLTLPEAATIAGLFQHRGGYYSPIVHPDHARRSGATSCCTACSRSATSSASSTSRP